MTGPRRPNWQRLRPLLTSALDLAPDHRQSFLEQACDGEPELLRDALEILRAEEEDTGFLEPESRPAVATAEAGERVGPYRLEHCVGVGGMGEVWSARREDADFEQRVAVKLIKPGLDTQAVLRRFRLERRVLARLSHPGIPRLLDGGAQPDGRPYLVMEYVEGEPLDEHVRGLALVRRLHLFLALCDAVAHAHREGIVHRDLKPSNVLVTAEGAPKVLDFGIAKVLSSTEGFETLDLTATQQRLLTPRYATPEQVRGAPVSPATDVYGLGLLLYELLTDRPAQAEAGVSAAELEEAVCERPPPQPSRAVPDDTQARALRGDLDTICRMALRKEPERRYANASALADDLRRHLARRPVLARPDTMVYRVQTFARRHRGLVAGAVGTVLALTIGLVAAWAQYLAAERALDEERWTSYTSSLASAEAALRDGQVVEARTALEGAPEELRGWEWEHLFGRLDRSLETIQTESLHVLADLSWSPEGDRVASVGSLDVRVWDLPGAGEPLHVLHADPPVRTSAVAWRPGSEEVAWGDVSGQVWLASSGDDEPPRRLFADDPEGAEDEARTDYGAGAVHELAWNADGSRLALLLARGTLHILDPERPGESVFRYAAHSPSAFMRLRWHPDGERLATASWDEMVQLFSTAERRHLRGWSAHGRLVDDLDFDPAGELLVTASMDSEVKVWDVATGELVRRLRPHTGPVMAVRFLGDGERLLTCGQNGELHVTRWRDGEVLARWLGNLHPARVLELAPDGRRAATVDVDGTLRTWNVETQDVAGAVTCEFPQGLAVGPEGERFATASPDGFLRVWSRAGAGVELLWERDPGLSYAMDVAWSADGRWIASTHLEGALLLWDPESGEARRRLVVPDRRADVVGFTPDGGTVAGLFRNDAEEGELLFWDTESGARSRGVTLGEASDNCKGVALWNDGSFHLGTGYRLLHGDAAGRLEDLELEGVRWMTPDPERDRVILFGERVILADRRSLAVERAWTPSTAETWNASTHPSGTRLALAIGTTIELWDPRVPRRLTTLHGHPGMVTHLAWTPAGDALVSVCGQGVIRVWEGVGRR